MIPSVISLIIVLSQKLSTTYSGTGWVCDGRDFPGGCRSGQTDFNQTSATTVTFRNIHSGVDLCEKCAREPLMGGLSPETAKKDVDDLLAICATPHDFTKEECWTVRLAAIRILTALRRNWRYVLPFYLQQDLLSAIRRVLKKIDDIQMCFDEGNFRFIGHNSGGGGSKKRGGGGGDGARDGATAAARKKMKQPVSSSAAEKSALRVVVNTLFVEVTDVVFNGYRGGLHAQDPCYYYDDFTKKWLTGRFLAFGDSGEVFVDVTAPKAFDLVTPAVPKTMWCGSSDKKVLTPAKVWKKFAILPWSEDEGAESEPTKTLDLADELSKGPSATIEKVTDLMKEVDVSATNAEGATVLFIALQHRVCADILKEMVTTHGCCVDICALRAGVSAYEMAKLQNYEESVLELLSSEERRHNKHAQLGPDFQFLSGGAGAASSQSAGGAAASSTAAVGVLQPPKKYYELADGSKNSTSGRLNPALEDGVSSDDEEEIADILGRSNPEDSGDESQDERAENLQEMLGLERSGSKGANNNKRRRGSTGGIPDDKLPPSSQQAAEKKQKSPKRGKKDEKATSPPPSSPRKLKKVEFHNLPLETLRERYATKFWVTMSHLIIGWPMVGGGAVGKASTGPGSGLSATGAVQAGEKFLPTLELTHAGTIGPALMASAVGGGHLQGGPVHSSKNFCAVIDQLPIEFLYAMVPVLKSPNCFDSISVSKRAFRHFSVIVRTILSTDSLLIAYHGCRVLNVLARQDWFAFMRYELLGKEEATLEALFEKNFGTAAHLEQTDSMVVDSETAKAEKGASGASSSTAPKNPFVYEEDYLTRTKTASGLRFLKSRYLQKRDIPDNLFARYLISQGGRRWAERIAKSTLAPAAVKSVTDAFLARVRDPNVGYSTMGASRLRGDPSSTTPKTATPKDENLTVALGLFRHTDNQYFAVELQKEAAELLHHLNAVCDPRETPNLRAAENPLAKLDSGSSSDDIYDALVDLRTFLSSSAGSMLEEIEQCYSSYMMSNNGGLTSAILDLLQGGINTKTTAADNIGLFHEVFANDADFRRLTNFLHETIEMGETFPVWLHRPHKGMQALTEVMPLKLCRVGASCSSTSAPSSSDGGACSDKDGSVAAGAAAPAAGSAVVGAQSSGPGFTTTPAKEKEGEASAPAFGSSGGLFASLLGLHGAAGATGSAPAEKKSDENAERIEHLLPVDPTVYRPESLLQKNFGITVEPLVSIEDVSHYIQQISPVRDVGYLEYCYTLIGSVISIREREYFVEDFCVYSGELHLPVHTLGPVPIEKKRLLRPRDSAVSSSRAASPADEEDEKAQKLWVLNTTRYEVLSLPTNAQHFVPGRVDYCIFGELLPREGDGVEGVFFDGFA